MKHEIFYEEDLKPRRPVREVVLRLSWDEFDMLDDAVRDAYTAERPASEVFYEKIMDIWEETREE